MGEDGRDPKAELLHRLNELLGQLLKQRPDDASKSQKIFGAVKAFLQSTFFLSVVSGVLLAWLPFEWQRRAAQLRENESNAQQIAERKDRLAYSFAKDFPLTLHLAVNFRSRQLWMGQPGARGTNYPDGRTFAETRDYTDKLIGQYFSLGPAASTCNQIVASFPNITNITSRARLLNENLNQLLLATNLAGVDGAFDAANLQYQLLTEAIFTELNKRNENDNSLP